MNKNRKISNILINPSYQLKYIFWITTTGILLVALNSGIFYYFIQENYSILVELSPMTEEAKSQLYSELRQIVLGLVLASGVFLSFVAMIGLIMSHRTAGPLYHFKRVFEQIRKGDRDARIKLRPSDDFREVAEQFNLMMDELNTPKGPSK